MKISKATRFENMQPHIPRRKAASFCGAMRLSKTSSPLKALAFTENSRNHLVVVSMFSQASKGGELLRSWLPFPPGGYREVIITHLYFPFHAATLFVSLP